MAARSLVLDTYRKRSTPVSQLHETKAKPQISSASDDVNEGDLPCLSKKEPSKHVEMMVQKLHYQHAIGSGITQHLPESFVEKVNDFVFGPAKQDEEEEEDEEEDEEDDEDANVEIDLGDEDSDTDEKPQQRKHHRKV